MDAVRELNAYPETYSVDCCSSQKRRARSAPPGNRQYTDYLHWLPAADCHPVPSGVSSSALVCSLRIRHQAILVLNVSQLIPMLCVCVRLPLPLSLSPSLPLSLFPSPPLALSPFCLLSMEEAEALLASTVTLGRMISRWRARVNAFCHVHPTVERSMLKITTKAIGIC